MRIVHVPAPVLSSPTKPIKKFDEKLGKLIADMEKTLLAQTDPEGVGLAAPQVGVSSQLFIMKKSKTAKLQVFVNPRIISKVAGGELNKQTDKKTNKLEGCLSIPRIWGKVGRSKKIILEYCTQDGKKLEKDFVGFEAIIIEHEMDHLNGILFTKRVLEQGNQLYIEKQGELETYDL